jgi:hypothetical protein
MKKLMLAISRFFVFIGFVGFFDFAIEGYEWLEI